MYTEQLVDSLYREVLNTTLKYVTLYLKFLYDLTCYILRAHDFREPLYSRDNTAQNQLYILIKSKTPSTLDSTNLTLQVPML